MKVDPMGQHREVDPSAGNNYCIRLASSKGFPEIVKLLLTDPRVNPSRDNDIVLLHAVENNNIEVVRVLMEYGKLIF
jgi:hypothetical protein